MEQTTNLIRKLGIESFDFYGNLNALDSYGNNALILLLRNGFLEAAELTIKKGTKVNYVSPNESSPIKALAYYAEKVSKETGSDKEIVFKNIKNILDYIINFGLLSENTFYMDGKTNKDYINLINSLTKINNNVVGNTPNTPNSPIPNGNGMPPRGPMPPNGNGMPPRGPMPQRGPMPPQ